MSANLYGDRYFGREAGWHKAGIVISDRDVTAVEAVDIAGLDYDVLKLPMKVQLLDGSYIDSDKYALTRMPTPDDSCHRVFSVVSEDYTILSNRDVFGVLNPLSELWPVETAGAIEMGARAFMSLKAGEYEVKARNGTPDLLQLYYLVVNSFTGATQIRFTPIRVVCKNTLMLSEREYTVNANVRHKGAALLEYGAMLKLVAQLQGVKQNALDILSIMATTLIEREDVAEIFNAAYPLPRKGKKVLTIESINIHGDGAFTEADRPFIDTLKSAADRHEYNTTRMQGHHDKLFRLYEWYNDNHMAFANTAWQAYQVVTDYIDHEQSGGNRAESSVFGTRAAQKGKAFSVAASLVR